MSTDNQMSFECVQCGKSFHHKLFDIARAFERIDYSTEIPSIDVKGSECLAEYCSAACRELGRDAAMRHQGVQLRSVGIGPVENCALCLKPVDMSAFHLTYTENDMTVMSFYSLQPTNARYLAVLCRSCAPERTAYCEKLNDQIDSEVVSEHQVTGTSKE